MATFLNPPGRAVLFTGHSWEPLTAVSPRGINLTSSQAGRSIRSAVQRSATRRLPVVRQYESRHQITVWRIVNRGDPVAAFDAGRFCHVGQLAGDWQRLGIGKPHDPIREYIRELEALA